VGLQRSGLFSDRHQHTPDPDEAAYIVNDCGARVLIVSSALAPLAEALVDLTPGSSCGSPWGRPRPAGYDSYDEFVQGHPATPLADEQEGSPMLYSSGTTGRP
jgi:long-chain acyl-CoA synthetase